MKRTLALAVMGVLLIAAQALAQQVTVTGKVTNELGAPLAGAQIVISGTSRGTLTTTPASFPFAPPPASDCSSATWV